MKKTITHKTATTSEKEKRKPAPVEDAPKVEASPPLEEPKRRSRKTVAEAPPPVAEASPEKPKTRRKRGEAPEEAGARPKAGRSPRSKTFGFEDELMQGLGMEDEAGATEEAEEELAIDPLDIPLELLDPELVEVPRPASTPKPKPKPITNKRQLKCANCGNTFLWLSVEQLCFSCLKKKMAQRKREDETYPGFTGEPEDEEEAT